MFWVFFLVNLIFLYFLWFIHFKIGLYLILGIIAVLIIFSFFTNEWKIFWKAIFKLIFIDYISYVNLIFLIIGSYLILIYFLPLYFSSYVNIIAIFICLWVLIILGIIWILINKIDWVKLVFFWSILLWAYLFYLYPYYNLFYYFVAFILWVSTFLNLVYFIKNNKNLQELIYVIFVSFIVAIIILFSRLFHFSYIGIAILAQLIVWVILIIWNLSKYFLKKLNKIAAIMQEYNHELTLFGYSDIEISDKDKNFFTTYSKYYSLFLNISRFFDNSPFYIKFILSLTNTIPLIIATYYFFLSLGKYSNSISEILYRIWIILFFANFILFKELKWFVVIQRFFSFLVLNVIIYFTIINFLGKNYFYLAFWGILWNLFSTILILFLWKKLDFEPLDFLNWLIINFIVYFLNIYFLSKLEINNYLFWWILFLYTGLYIFISRQIYSKL